ncbi:MAG TPA: hypothetical protein VN872_10925 [Candidatus Acidoferrum sp.]|nr:hypothetical protein [Candidatus Acidoferrum sp.]
MLKRVARAILCILVLALACDLPLVAQKLHNETRDKLAQQVKNDFEQLASPDGNIFEQAIKNAEATNDADIKQWRDRERTLIDSVATTMPFKKWAELQALVWLDRSQILDVTRDPKNASLPGTLPARLKEIDKEKTDIDARVAVLKAQDPIPTVQKIEEAIKKALEDGKQLGGDVTKLKEKIESLKSDFDDLKGDFDDLKNIVASLQPQGLTRLQLETRLLMLQNEQARLELHQTHFKERQAKLEKFAAHVKQYAGEDKTGADTKEITCETVRKDLAQPNHTLDSALGGEFYQVLGEICSDAYSPTQTVMACLQNLAQNAQAKTSSEKNGFCTLNKKPKSTEKQESEEQKANKTQKGGKNQKSGKNQKLSEKQQSQETQQSENKPSPKPCSDIDPEDAGDTKGRCIDPQRQLMNLLNALDGVLHMLAVRYDLLIEQTNLSQDEYIFQIRMMQLNTQENEVLLHAGITGLATYEAGGIKPEDVANIIHTAQALATAAIAARVK